MKNLIRVVVLAGIFTWPAIETYRWYAAEQDLAARKQIEAKVMQHLAAAKQKNVQMAQTVPEPH